MDVVVILDASGNVKESSFETAKTFLADVINGVDVTIGRTRIGLVTYGSDVSLQFHMNQYSSR